MVQDQPTILRNPSNDAAFEAAIQALMNEGVTELGAFRTRLRESFPLAEVRRRELAWESEEVWYVYRDGRWTSGDRPSREGPSQ